MFSTHLIDNTNKLLYVHELLKGTTAMRHFSYLIQIFLFFSRIGEVFLMPKIGHGILIRYLTSPFWKLSSIFTVHVLLNIIIGIIFRKIHKKIAVPESIF